MCMARKDLVENMKKEKRAEMHLPMKEWGVEKWHHSVQESNRQKKYISEHSV